MQIFFDTPNDLADLQKLTVLPTNEAYLSNCDNHRQTKMINVFYIKVSLSKQHQLYLPYTNFQIEIVQLNPISVAVYL
ncbi:unnamed protein product [Rotaria sp. Silwood1]|nr:unnamed protein product [Rotaria sp. Silwood1]